MTTEVQEDNANPYNQKKSWHEGVEESFEDATGMYFEKPKAKAIGTPKNRQANNNDIKQSVLIIF